MTDEGRKGTSMLNDNPDAGRLVDHGRSVRLDDVGLPGYAAVVSVDQDGYDWLVLARLDDVGAEGQDVGDDDQPHEQVGPLPDDVWRRAWADVDFPLETWISAVLCCPGIASVSVRATIVHLGMTANRSGTCARMSTARLMEDLGVSRSMVSRARDTAVKFGLMRCTRQSSRGLAEYQLLLSAGAAEYVRRERERADQ